MFKKLNLASSLAALIFFAFPWIDIQCSGKSLATQSGFQVIYGGGSPSAELERMGDSGQSKKSTSSGESMGFAPLVALALIAVIGSIVCAFMAIFRGGERADKLSSGLPAAALLLLVLQLIVGFPVEKEMIESMSKGTTTDQAGSDNFGNSMATAMMNIQAKTAPAFYLELLALGIPSLFFANGLIDRYRKDRPEEGQLP